MLDETSALFSTERRVLKKSFTLHNCTSCVAIGLPTTLGGSIGAQTVLTGSHSRPSARRQGGLLGPRVLQFAVWVGCRMPSGSFAYQGPLQGGWDHVLNAISTRALFRSVVLTTLLRAPLSSSSADRQDALTGDKPSRCSSSSGEGLQGEDVEARAPPYLDGYAAEARGGSQAWVDVRQ